jgi:hypothetical protein
MGVQLMGVQRRETKDQQEMDVAIRRGSLN